MRKLERPVSRKLTFENSRNISFQVIPSHMFCLEFSTPKKGNDSSESGSRTFCVWINHGVL